MRGAAKSGPGPGHFATTAKFLKQPSITTEQSWALATPAFVAFAAAATAAVVAFAAAATGRAGASAHMIRYDYDTM